LVANFSLHPSHGTTFLGSRLIIWKGAVDVWGSSPWIGVGPGRFGYEYLRHGGSIPPDFWALSAHSLPFQVLAEFGVVGELIFLALLGSVVSYLLFKGKNARTSEKARCQAVLIGIGVWFAQVLLDDFTDYPGVMVILILMLAWVITSSDVPVERWSAVSGNVLMLPALMIIGWQSIQVWSYSPMEVGLREAQQDSWLSAAEKFTMSARRDPNLIFYMTQAGLAHSMAWAQTQQYSNLSAARYFFQRALMMEENVSLLWANLAVLDWYSGDSFSAIQHMARASKLAPRESAYLVNLGWFFEQNGDVEQAKRQYFDALSLSVSIASHPFWQLTPLRKEVLNEWMSNAAPSDFYPSGYWKRAQDALYEGDINQAKYYIALSEWVGESQIAVLTIKAELCEVTNESARASACYQQLADRMKTPVFRYQETYFVNTYSLWLYHRKGLSFDLVPGFLQLIPDYGQFEALNRLYQIYSKAGECDKAEETWRVMQIALNGGALEPILEAPACRN
ncbi:MAG: O-antigen ligase family protein, partial [Anaerolineales bacterium]